MAGSDGLVAVNDLLLGTVVMMAPDDAAAAVSKFPQRYSFVGANPQPTVRAFANFTENPESTPLPVITGDTSQAPALGSLMSALAGLGLVVNHTTTMAPGNIGLPMISGTAQVGQTLTSTQGVWTNSPTSLLYQWYSGGAPISMATGTTYTSSPSDIGNQITVSVTAINNAGVSGASISAPTAAVIDVFPANHSLPVVTGAAAAQVGVMLMGSVGGWAGTPTFTFQWNRGGTPIGGATSLTYTPVAADVGTLLTLSVTAMDTGGTNTATSAATAAVLPAIPTIMTVPTISGTAQVGQVLTATTGTWRNIPTSYAYQWLSGGVNATGPGAATSSYTAVSADIGNVLTVSVIATNAGGSSAPAVSAATAAVIPIAMAPVNTAVPTISGTAQVGQTLTGTNGTWTNSPTSYAYQWNRAGVAIGGATASTYVPVAADIGSTLTLTVIASNATGASSPATSVATAAVIDIIPTITTAPSIPGMPQVGTPITSVAGVWTHNPTSVTYQWKVAGTNGTGAGATTRTYTPVSGDATKTLTMTETATNSGGTSAPSTSAASAAVAAVSGSNSTMIVTAIAA
jgi:hypothetical protein